MNYGMLNLGSVVLGLIGWAIPVIHLRLVSGQGKRGLGRCAYILSMGVCGLAIWLQICYDEHLVNIEDWSALMDTIGAVRMISAFLLVTTLLINLITAFGESGLDAELKEDQDLTI